MIRENISMAVTAAGSDDGRETYEVRRAWNPDGGKALGLDVFASVNLYLREEEKTMAGSILLFALGFTCVTSVYEISKTGKSSKSDKVRRSAAKFAGRK